MSLADELYGDEPQSGGLADDLYGAAPAAPVKLGKEGAADALKSTLADAGWLGRNLAGVGSAPQLAWEGIKDIFGKGNQENIAAQKTIAEEAPVGNIAGNLGMFYLGARVPGVAPAISAIPGAATVPGAAAISAAGGALYGGLMTPGSLSERVKAALWNAGGAAAGTVVGKLVQGSAPIAASPEVALLAREGVGLTPGQNMGGFAKSMEDKLTSVPLFGDVIQNARRRGIEDFDKAAIARVTEPMAAAGMPIQASGVGRGAVQDLRQQLGQAYDTVLARSSANALEPQFVQQMASLRAMAQNLPAKEAAAFDSIIDREIGNRMARNGMVNAENLQGVKSGLGNEIANFSTSTDAYQRQLGQALKQANAEFQDLVRRANPQNAGDLKAIDTAYANFKRIQRAAGGLGAEDGVFTPTQLTNAVRAMDKTKDKRGFSEGTALLQDLAEAGKTVMPSKIPDSGTPGRLLANLTSPQGLLSLTVGGAAAIPASIAYSRAGQAAINYLTNKGIKPTAEAVRQLMANPAAMGVTGMTLADLAR